MRTLLDIQRETGCGVAEAMHIQADEAQSSLSPAVGSPVRVRLSRAKGWRLPSNTVIVSRPSEFGNPFKLLEIVRGKKYTVQTLVSFGSRCWWGSKHSKPSDMDQRAARQHAVECFELWINGDTTRTDLILPENFAARITEKLRGRNLACWCPLDEPCHADVLLRLANGGPAERRPLEEKT
jgi:hypothetical protein